MQQHDSTTNIHNVHTHKYHNNHMKITKRERERMQTKNIIEIACVCVVLTRFRFLLHFRCLCNFLCDQNFNITLYFHLSSPNFIFIVFNIVNGLVMSVARRSWIGRSWTTRRALVDQRFNDVSVQFQRLCAESPFLIWLCEILLFGVKIEWMCEYRSRS